MVAGMLFLSYMEFCSKDPERPSVALDNIKTDTGLMDLLSPTIVAGSRFDEEHYWEEAVSLVSGENVALRKGAIFSLGKFEYANNSTLPAKSIALLTKIVSDTTDDDVLAFVIQTSFDLLQKDNSLLPETVDLTNLALSKGEDFSLHAASKILGLYTKRIPENLSYIYINHLKKVKHENRNTLDNIDYALDHLLRRADPTMGVDFLEALLVANREVRINVFNSAARELLKNKDNLLNRLSTRWLARGKPELCRALPDLLSMKHDDSTLHLQIVSEELIGTDFVHLLFIAQKAVGHLFFTPVTATSVLTSLLEVAGDDYTKAAISNLLFEPLLKNYPATVRTYLKSVLEEDTKTYIQNALSALDEYIEDLQGIDEIYEHHTPLGHREAYHKHSSLGMSEAVKEAESKSALLSLANRSVLLYGKKFISYVAQRDSPPKRMEVPLQEYSVQMEAPRLQNIDPLGLELMLHRFKYEQLIQ